MSLTTQINARRKAFRMNFITRRPCCVLLLWENNKKKINHSSLGYAGSIFTKCTLVFTIHCIFLFPEVKEIMSYCSKWFLLKKGELPKVMRRCPKPCSTIPLSRENRFNPFDSVRLATCVSKFRDISKG